MSTLPPDHVTPSGGTPETAATRSARDYAELASGRRRDGERGRVVFAVSTDDVSLGKGDLFVALGLARSLSALGWGVSLHPMSAWWEPVPDDVDVVVSMLESFVPGRIPPHVATVAWIRNWTTTWARQPYLREFDEVWTSSTGSRDHLPREVAARTRIVPIAVDTALFAGGGSERDLEVVSTANSWGAVRDVSATLEVASQTLDVHWYGHGLEDRGEQADSRIRFHSPVPFFELPGLYARAHIVIDDLIPQAKEFGSQNSRLFEALASGATVVTNTSRGLEDLGLADVPSYEAPEDFARIARGILDGEAPWDGDTTARLAAIVRERHSYDARAAELSPVLADAIERTRGRSARSEWLAWSSDLQSSVMSLEVQRDQWQDIAQRAEWDVADRDREIAALAQRVEDLEERIRSAEAALEENRRFLSRTSLRLGARVAHASDVVVGRLRRR